MNEVEWLKSRGAVGESRNTLWHDFLSKRGYKGTLADMRAAYKKDQEQTYYNVGFNNDDWVVKGDWFIINDELHANGRGEAVFNNMIFAEGIYYRISFELEGEFDGNGAVTYSFGKTSARAARNLGLNSFVVNSLGGNKISLGVSHRDAFQGVIKNFSLKGE